MPYLDRPGIQQWSIVFLTASRTEGDLVLGECGNSSPHGERRQMGQREEYRMLKEKKEEKGRRENLHT